jgi:glycosyltransferase involved in cell wall biosynthesis
MAHLNIVFITQSVDEADHGRATAVRWLKTMSEHPDVNNIIALTLNKGAFSLPSNVTVRDISCKSRFATLVNFYNEVFNAYKNNYKIFFVHQGGSYPILLMPFRLLLGIKIYQWKAHPVINRTIYFSAKYCDNLVFTCNKLSFPLKEKNIRIVGHGINTLKFSPQNFEKTFDLITTGRIAPRKHIDKVIKVIERLRDKHSLSVIYNIYGPIRSGDEKYVVQLKELIKDCKLENSVFINKSVNQSELPIILNQHKIFVNLSRTALDKSTLEAMSSGLVVLSDNENYLEILPQNLREKFGIHSESSIADIADRLYEILNYSNNYLVESTHLMRRIVIENHDDVRLMSRIVSHIKSDLNS